VQKALRLLEIIFIGDGVALEDLGGDGDLALFRRSPPVVDATSPLEVGLGLAGLDDVEHERLELL